MQWRGCPTLQGSHLHLLKRKVPFPQSFGSCQLQVKFLSLPPWDCLRDTVGENQEKEKEKAKQIFTLSPSIRSPSIRSPLFLLLKLGLEGFFWSTVCTAGLSLGFQAALCSGQGMLKGKKNNKLTTILVAFQILVFFPNPPATNYSSEFSNCSMHCVHISQLCSMGDTGYRVLIPSLLEQEP